MAKNMKINFLSEERAKSEYNMYIAKDPDRKRASGYDVVQGEMSLDEDIFYCRITPPHVKFHEYHSGLKEYITRELYMLDLVEYNDVKIYCDNETDEEEHCLFLPKEDAEWYSKLGEEEYVGCHWNGNYLFLERKMDINEVIFI